MQYLSAVVVFLAASVLSLPSYANGRSPCDRGAGGISHCMGQKFVCNNGTISRSKKVCTGASAGTSKKSWQAARDK